jgi:hypothetical protein
MNVYLAQKYGFAFAAAFATATSETRNLLAILITGSPLIRSIKWSYSDGIAGSDRVSI